MQECKQGAEREGERKSQEGSLLSAQSLTQAQSHKLRGRDLSQNQELGT